MKPLIVSAAIVLVVTAAAGIWLVNQDVPGKAPSDLSDVNDEPSSLTNEDVAVQSPFDVVDTDDQVSNGQADNIVVEKSATPATSAPTISNNSDLPSWDAPLNDDELRELVARLKSDPGLLQQIVDEFRQETDPARKQQLAVLLGQVGGEQATLLASELIFSGDAAARTLGMSLLQDIQPGNEQARDIVSGMLSTEIEPEVLIDAMTALSRPGDVDAGSRAYLSDQLAWLTTHQDDGVRSISLDILSRWSQDGRYTDAIVAGLDDKSAYVRASAAYSLVGHEDSSPVVIERLFGTLKGGAETKSVKRAAILALKSMPLSSAQKAELDALELRLNSESR